MVRRTPHISDYGLIGNCRTAALVSDRGSIEWCCLPYFDSDAYFGAILDRTTGGLFQICPSVPFQSHQSYLPDTNVLETTFETSSGTAKVTDCFSCAGERRKSTGFFPTEEILRKVEVTQGSVPFLVRYSPKLHYNSHRHFPRDQGKLGIVWSCGHDELVLMYDTGPAEVTWEEGPGSPELSVRFELREAQHRFFSVSYHKTAPAIIPALGADAQARLDCTIEFWRHWIAGCHYRGLFSEQVRRSALALKLMTFAPSGAIVASPTSSLPEWIGGVRNWDYRYSWMRDAAFTVRALTRLGFLREARAYLNWMLDTGPSSRSRYKIMYTLFGAQAPREYDLYSYRGFRNSRPVHVGNDATGQFQLDVFGEILDSILSFPEAGIEFDQQTRKFLAGMGRLVCQNWRKPDDGIWESRSTRLHHTHSKVMCWVALKRLIDFGRHTGDDSIPVSDYVSECARIRLAIENDGFNTESQSYTGAFHTTAMDAALLTLPLVGYCSPDSVRMRGTIRRIQQELAVGELVYRYRRLDDGIPGKEGCFGVCSFWLIEALARSGSTDEALRLFKQFLARGNSVGLWPEEIDPGSGEFLGNYPQAFTHIGLINAALTLEELKVEDLAA